MRLQQQKIAQSVTMSVTTRDVGIGTTQMAAIINMYSPNVVVPNIYGMYRVFLALLEAKLELIRRTYAVIIQDMSVIHTYVYAATFLGVY